MLKWIASGKAALPLLFFGMVGVAVLIPWRAHYTNIFLVSSGVLWFLFLKENKAYFTKPAVYYILLLTSLFIVEVIGLVYTQNLDYGLHRLESKLPMVIFPIIVFSSGLNSKHVERLLAVFVLSTVVACLYCTSLAFIDIIQTEKPLIAFIQEEQYSNIYLSEPLFSIHPTFLTLFICLAVFSIAIYMRQLKGHYWLLLVILFLLVFSFQLASRAGYVALLCTMVLIGFSFIGLKRRALLLIYVGAIVAVFALSIILIPQLRERLVDSVLEVDLQQEQLNSVSYHLKSWICSVESWYKGNILFGYGTGDEVITLAQCYEDKNWLVYNHDAHNEFLSSLVKHGLLGLTVLSIMFFYPFYLSIRYRDLRYFTFLTTVLVCFMSESMLRGHNGLLFFTCFHALFLKDLLLRKKIIKSPSQEGVIVASLDN